MLFLLQPGSEKNKKLFFRSKNDPKFGVKLGVKVTHTKNVRLTNCYSVSAL